MEEGALVGMVPLEVEVEDMEEGALVDTNLLLIFQLGITDQDQNRKDFLTRLRTSLSSIKVIDAETSNENKGL